MRKVFFFSTQQYNNVLLACASRRYAVSVPDNDAFARNLKGKAQRQVLSGDLMAVWVTANDPLRPSRLMLLSEIVSQPDIGKTIHDDPFPGAWAFPFDIRPLGSCRSALSRDDLMSNLSDRCQNISRYLMLSGNMTFSPCWIAPIDLDYIVRSLLDDKATIGSYRQYMADYCAAYTQHIEAAAA